MRWWWAGSFGIALRMGGSGHTHTAPATRILSAITVCDALPPATLAVVGKLVDPVHSSVNQQEPFRIGKIYALKLGAYVLSDKLSF